MVLSWDLVVGIPKNDIVEVEEIDQKAQKPATDLDVSEAPVRSNFREVLQARAKQLVGLHFPLEFAKIVEHVRDLGLGILDAACLVKNLEDQWSRGKLH